MKKTYIIPQTNIRFVELEGLVATSLKMSEGEINNASNVYVKEDNSTSSSRDSYNVWDDDWSK